MDNQPMGQTPNPVPNPMMNQTPEMPIGQGPSNTVWYAVGAIVVIALGFWYYYSLQPQTANAPAVDMQTSTTDQAQTAPLMSGNTTADIANDLSQTLDTSTTLDADASASADAISNL